MGSQHHPKTVIVVIVVRIVVAIRRGDEVLIVIEGTAPQHLPDSLTDRSQQHQYSAPPNATPLTRKECGGFPLRGVRFAHLEHQRVGGQRRACGAIKFRVRQ